MDVHLQGNVKIKLEHFSGPFVTHKKIHTMFLRQGMMLST